MLRSTEVCKEKYSGYTTVYRQFNIPWYAVKNLVDHLIPAIMFVKEKSIR